MLVSVFTPTHNARFLDDCYRSLVAQTMPNWEWVILLNHGAKDWRPPTPDERVKVTRAINVRGVGALKRAACAYCAGEVLVELDHDDLLTPNCLAEVHDAFVTDPNTALVFSDCAQINEDGTRNDDRFNEEFGWVYSGEKIGDSEYLCCHAMAPYPHNVAYIWYAPNHVRAFRRITYNEVGGYNDHLHVLDDQELMIRLFLAGDFHHVDSCLYLQRVHARNTQVDPTTNAFIQEQTVRYYEQYIGALAHAWAERRGLGVITLSTATSPDPPDDSLGDIVTIDPDRPVLEFDDDSVAIISAPELLQRLPDRAQFFNECYRVLVHGGLILTETPSTDGRGAFQDPSHIAFYNENSFWYLTQSRLRSSLPTLRARLQISHLRTYFPSSWHETAQVPYVQANLLAIKDGPRLGGPLSC